MKIFKKKKLSIDFLEPSYRLLTDVAKKQDVSNSTIVNTLIDLFLGLSPDILSDLGSYCKKRAQEEIIITSERTGYDHAVKHTATEQYKRISDYFYTLNHTSNNNNNNMQRIYLKTGYVIFPEDWIVLPDVYGSPDTCMYAGVVESRNSGQYDIPHFVFFSDYRYGSDYPAELRDKVYAQCAAVYPDFRRLYNLQIPAPDITRTDPEGLELIKKWKNAPDFGLFHIVEQYDPIYWNQYTPDYQPPYGAMIIRNA